jgi:hypothetical protein
MCARSSPTILLTSRPLLKLEVRGRYRRRDYDNRSDEILFTETSTRDAALAAETKRSFAPSFTAQNASFETSYRVVSARGNGETHTSGAPVDAADFPDVEDLLWAPTASLRYRYDERVSVIAGTATRTTTRKTGSSTTSA